MKTRFLAIVLSFFALAVHSQTLTLKTFTEDAAKLGLRFVMPSGYHIKETLSNRDLQYSFAIINSDSTMEVRYSFFPLKPLLKKYALAKKAKKIMINPDSIYLGLMKANSMSMTNGIIPDVNEVPSEIANGFNADYVGTHSFEFMCEFGKGYIYGQFLCLHKKSVADVIITFMSNDIKTHADLMAIPYYALTFK